jgi:alpha-glucosidase
MDVPELDFIDQVPTFWDDTRVIDGYPGEFAVIARRAGDRWFIGALNGPRSRYFKIPLDFLETGVNHEATLYFDDPGTGTMTGVGIEKRKVTCRDTITRDIKQGNGLAMIIERE